MFSKLIFVIIFTMPLCLIAKNVLTYTDKDTGIRVIYPECLSYSDKSADGDVLVFQASGTCKDRDYTNGSGDVTIWHDSGFKTLRQYKNSIHNKNLNIIFHKDQKIGENKGFIMATLVDENDPSIDSKLANNYVWGAGVMCKSILVSVSWSEFLNKSDREKVRKNAPSIPLPFKELVEGLRCK